MCKIHDNVTAGLISENSAMTIFRMIAVDDRSTTTTADGDGGGVLTRAHSVLTTAVHTPLTTTRRFPIGEQHYKSLLAVQVAFGPHTRE